MPRVLLIKSNGRYLAPQETATTGPAYVRAPHATQLHPREFLITRKAESSKSKVLKLVALGLYGNVRLRHSMQCIMRRWNARDGRPRCFGGAQRGSGT